MNTFKPDYEVLKMIEDRIKTSTKIKRKGFWDRLADLLIFDYPPNYYPYFM